MQTIMYAGQVNSRQTQIAVAITAAVATISVLDASVLPAAPNIVTIGSDETAETILYAGKSGNDLTGCIRGFQGTANAWGVGNVIGRMFTAYDYDTILANILDLNSNISTNYPSKSTADVTYYVRKDGNDNNNGLANTAAGAFLTIAKAVSMIPQICNHTFTINVGIGTYAEDLIITGFTGNGTMKLIGAGAVLSDSYIFSSVVVKFCNINVLVQGFKASTTGNAFNGAISSNVAYDFCKTDVSALGTYACRFDVCTAYISNCLLSNRYATIDAESNSRVYSINNSGTGNTFGLAAHSNSTIGKSGTQSTATTPEIIDSGSMIIGASGVSNPWGDNTTANRSGVDLTSGPLTLTTALTFYKIPYNTRNNDNLNEYDTAAMKFTTKKGGRYRVSLGAILSSPAQGTRFVGTLNKNGVQQYLIAEGYNSSAGNDLGIHGGVEITLAANDYLEFYLYSTTANVSLNTSTATYNHATITQIT